MMQEEIIKTALLGTANVPFQPSGDLKDLAERVALHQEDREDGFLKYAGAAFLYQASGLEPADGTSSIEECPPEIKSSLSPLIDQHLRDALIGKDEVLLGYLLTQAVKVEKVASASVVPLLLNKALEQKGKAEWILQVCGVLGQWLCGLNPEWGKISEKETQVVDWETGSHQERKLYFAALRQGEPAAALDLLVAGFDQENAANRADFVDLMEIGLSLEDEGFLMKSLGDKSKKVRDSALSLLRVLSGSQINGSFREFLLRAISVKEERHLLLLKKEVLHLDTAEGMPEDFFKLGIEKVSSEKGVDDTIFQLAQLFAYVDPAVLAQDKKMDKEEFLKLLLEHPSAGVFRPYLINAAIRFEDAVLAESLLKMENGYDAGLLRLLDEEKKGIYISKYLEQYFMGTLDMLLDDEYRILSLPLAERIIKRLAVNPYQITQPVYQRIGLSLPASASKLLELYMNDASDEDYQKRYFKNQAHMMLRYLELRASLDF